MDYAIGIDIGGTNTRVSAVEITGRRGPSADFRSDAHTETESYLAALTNAINTVRDAAGRDGCRGVGVGAPNGNFYDGWIKQAPNLTFAQDVPLVAELRQRTGLEAVYITNDANAAALGERLYGAARDLNDFITITLGTGLGAGIVTGGQVLYGHDGFAGELGHVTVIRDGRACGCGNRGCLETYCSATGIVRNFCELMATYNRRSVLASKRFDEIDARMIAEAAKASDCIAVEAYDMTGRILGQALAGFVTFSAPRKIFLFGGPVAAGNLLFTPAREALEASVERRWKGKIDVEPSGLPGGDAAILGAAALAWHSLGKG